MNYHITIHTSIRAFNDAQSINVVNYGNPDPCE
jgi:hypothetical protein